MSGGIKHIHKHKHKEEKKLKQKIEIKQSFILNYNIQYLKPRKEKDVGEKQKELKEKKKEKKKKPCGHCKIMFYLIMAIMVFVVYFLGPKSVP